VLSGVDVFAGSPWNAVGRIGSGRCSNTAFPAVGRAADAQKRVPTTTCLHLRGAGPWWPVMGRAAMPSAVPVSVGAVPPTVRAVAMHRVQCQR
jgi:hypothetical protein